MNFLRYCLIVPAAVSGLLFPLVSYAQTVEPYVVTASRFEQPINQVGSDVTVITAEEIRDKQITTLGEALRLVPGLRIAQTGNGASSIYARGSKSDSVLVLIDGIPISDASGLSVDASLFYLANAEKIEVVLGAQSALYGANALSGVINIVTRKGEGPANGSILIGAGAPVKTVLQANANGSNDKASWAIGFNSTNTNLFSTTNNKVSDYDSDFDAISEVGFNSSLTLTPSESFSLLAAVSVDSQESEYDSSWATNGDDLYSQYHRSFINLKPELILLDGLWTQHLNIAYTSTDRQYFDGDTDTYSSHNVFTDWQHKLALGAHNLAFGLSYKFDEQRPTYTSFGTQPEENFQTYTTYAEYSVNPFDTFYLTLAGRLDKGTGYDDIEPSGSIALAYTLTATDTLFNASAGKSFKAPSIVQYTANNKLNPEHAYIFDIGVTQPLFNNMFEISALYFNASYRDMIDYQTIGGISKPVNIEKMDAQGIELGVYANPIDELTASFTATFQDTKDHSTKKRQPKQADLELAFDIDYLLPIEAKDVYLGASVTYVDDRDDTKYGTWPAPNTTVTLDAYTTVDLRAKVYLEDNLALSLKLNNIFDEKYEETYGYNTLGFNGFASVEYTF